MKPMPLTIWAATRLGSPTPPKPYCRANCDKKMSTRPGDLGAVLPLQADQPAQHAGQHQPQDHLNRLVHVTSRSVANSIAKRRRLVN